MGYKNMIPDCRGNRAKCLIYDDAIGTNINGLLIPEDIVNGIVDEVHNINLSNFEINNNLDLKDVINEIEKILSGD